MLGMHGKSEGRDVKDVLVPQKQCRSKEEGGCIVVGVYGMYMAPMCNVHGVFSSTAFMFCCDDNDNKPYFLEAVSLTETCRVTVMMVMLCRKMTTEVCHHNNINNSQ